MGNVLEIIAIHVGDLLISGCDQFTDYNSFHMKGIFCIVDFEENGATYLRMGIRKVGNGFPDVAHLDSKGYEGESNDISISMGRGRPYFAI